MYWLRRSFRGTRQGAWRCQHIIASGTVWRYRRRDSRSSIYESMRNATYFCHILIAFRISRLKPFGTERYDISFPVAVIIVISRFFGIS